MEIPAFHPSRPDLVDPVPVDPAGLKGPTPGQARGPHWRRTSRGLFVPASVDPGVVEQRIVEAAAVLPDYGGVTGWAQLRWAGGTWFDGFAPDGRTARPVVLVTPRNDIRPQPGFVVSAEHLDADELIYEDGLHTTTSVRSLLFEVRFARSLFTAVEAIDMAAYSDLVSVAELRSFIARRVGWPGIRQARAACELADENCWSPRETWLRLVWMCDAGFSRPLMNMPVFDLSGRHLGTPDLLDVESGTAGEYEGAAYHLTSRDRHRDLAREDGLRRVGLEYFSVVKEDARHRDALVARMKAARSRAAWLPPDERRWTVVPPTWWVPTHTVALRRGLTGEQRQRWLARRQ